MDFSMRDWLHPLITSKWSSIGNKKKSNLKSQRHESSFYLKHNHIINVDLNYHLNATYLSFSLTRLNDLPNNYKYINPQLSYYFYYLKKITHSFYTQHT